MSFEKNPPREETFEQAEAIVDICLNADDVGMALSQAIQFDCMFRQGDVIGQWRAEQATYILRPGEVSRGPKVWSGMTIDQIQPDRELAVWTSKTGQPVVHAINKCTLIMRCIERLDRTNPIAPVASRPGGRPWADRQAFSKAWRKYATEAGVPKSVWNMDNRASAITEAAAAGVSDDDIANTAGNDKRTARRVYNTNEKDERYRSGCRRLARRHETTLDADGDNCDFIARQRGENPSLSAILEQLRESPVNSLTPRLPRDNYCPAQRGCRWAGLFVRKNQFCGRGSSFAVLPSTTLNST